MTQELKDFQLYETNKGPIRHAYGKFFSKDTADWRIELLCAFNYKLTPEDGGLGPKEHLWNAIKILYPYYHQKDNYFMDQFFDYALRNYETYSILGPGGFGKTTFEALYAILMYVCMPKNTIILCGTTTKDSSDRRIWGNITSLYNENYENHFSAFSTMTKDSIYFKEKIGSTWIADKKHGLHSVALPTGEGNVKALLKGTHPERSKDFGYGRLALFFDEYNESAPAHSVFSNLKRGAVEFKAFLTGNPTDRFDALGLASEPKDGWGSFDILKAKSMEDSVYETTIDKGLCLVFPGQLNPHIYYSKKEGRAYDNRFNFFTSLEEIEKEKKQLAPEEFYEQILGYFPENATGDRKYIVDKSDIIAHHAHIPTLWSGYGTKQTYIACDPAVTYGGDETIVRAAERGIFDNGKEGLCFLGAEHIYSIKMPKVLHEDKYDYLAKEILRITEKYKIKPENFSIDGNTYGNAVAERIKFRWSHDIHIVNPQGSPTDRPIYSGRTETARDECGNKLSELWFLLRKFLLAGQIRGLDNETIYEITTRSFEIKGRKATVEPKKDYKKRMSGIGRRGKSPDRSDCATILIDNARQQGFLVNMDEGHNANIIHFNDEQWEQEKEQRIVDRLYDELDSHYDDDTELDPISLDDDWY